MPVGVASTRGAPAALTVSQLAERIRLTIDEGFPRPVWVEGEISNPRRASTGHLYFTLKDDAAQLDAVMWSRVVSALPFEPTDGMQVLAAVRKVDFWVPRGKLSLQVDRLEPQGAGALARALEQLKQRLAAEGLFDEARKRRLPFLPRTIGVATAASGAAIHDVLEILFRRFPKRRVLVRPCRVQGDGAAEDIAEAVADLCREGSAEVIVVGRGGGSAEDLWAFNSELVVRAIVAAPVPVVAAVGHESDWTLADLAADLRVPTPSAAAQAVVPVCAELERDLAALGERLALALDRRSELARVKLERARAGLGDPRRFAEQRRLRADHLGERLAGALGALAAGRRRHLDGAGAALRARVPDLPNRRIRLDTNARSLATAMEGFLEARRRDLAERAARADALSPLAVLGRGFAMVRDAEGGVIRAAAALHVGDAVRLRFADGSAGATVTDVAPVATPGLAAADAMTRAAPRIRGEPGTVVESEMPAPSAAGVVSVPSSASVASETAEPSQREE